MTFTQERRILKPDRRIAFNEDDLEVDMDPLLTDGNPIHESSNEQKPDPRLVHLDMIVYANRISVHKKNSILKTPPLLPDQLTQGRIVSSLSKLLDQSTPNHRLSLSVLAAHTQVNGRKWNKGSSFLVLIN